MTPNPLHINTAAEQAAYEAIETAIINYFQVNACIVNLDTQQACIVFNTRDHQKWIARYNGHSSIHGALEIPLTIPLDRLPKAIRHSARPILNAILTRQEVLEVYRKWKPLVGKIVPGTITETTQAHFKISLKGATGIMAHRDAIKCESNELATSQLFHVNRVRLAADKVQIFLSRRSKTIPEYVLRQKFPKYKFHCYRRIPGAKAWIRTTAPRFRWGALLSKEIRTHLAGEYLQFFNWQKGADHE